jgi:hypothetical protein
MLRLLSATPPKPRPTSERENNRGENQVSFVVLARSTTFDGSRKVFGRGTGWCGQNVFAK